MHKNLLPLLDTGVCVIIRIKTKNVDIESLVNSLTQGGINTIEVSFDTPNAISLIKNIRNYENKKILLGAGTVFDINTAQSAIDAGAQFLVSPHMDANLLKFSAKKGVPFIPGVFTPGEIVSAWKNGTEIVKLYPVVGPEYIKILKNGPFSKITFMAVGGINLSNAKEYIKSGADILGIGSALVNDRLIDEKKWDFIQKNSKQFIEIVKSGRRKNG
ncbi:MAG TPA: bifunctional 4-hydroxy-2-oxoglutarate aldolase/2-dehydro-3-deoxy-phosphogluconate aldolase [bacterium]|nr:bifunctional 4-hydroxy-2-oxoglutarate aldolase/2-dehydro-3-deoxy-phosphogluconate aldolase [bacterium]HOL34626.1 bifunctional 4-hydroxy-2-oxoglutarate aldolase/2-dehydro-3-deoxy-phosphogluconate aldolase [bacterium]HPP08172.1 bifunctional 4-hydroxy-2-oxoglutarate aldolase/2-dehydro-3-deoxy-phosphogluconate aldolase [bacterium]